MKKERKKKSICKSGGKIDLGKLRLNLFRFGGKVQVLGISWWK